MRPWNTDPIVPAVYGFPPTDTVRVRSCCTPDWSV